MPLSNKELFKRGFLKQCQAEGLTDEGQILARIAEKRANWFVDFVNKMHEQNKLSQLPDSKVTSPIPTALALGVAAPFALGAGAGILGSKLKGNWLDEQDVHQQELIDELKRQTSLARQYHRIGGASPASF